MKKIISVIVISILLSGCNVKNKEIDNKTKVEKDVVKKKNLNENIMDLLDEKNIYIKLSGIIDFEIAKNTEIENAIVKAIDYTDEFGEIRYFYNYIDLNDDGKDEIFVFLVGQYVSGSGGSTALILNNDMKLIQEFSLINTPILISDERTNNYKDIVVPVFGGGTESKFVKLKYNGENYENNPSLVEEYRDEEFEGISIISDFEFVGDGILVGK